MRAFSFNQSPSFDKKLSLSQSFYRLLLAAYPAEFRDEYGREMLLVFRDLCRERAQTNGRLGLMQAWIRALLDLARTAPGERLQSFRKEFDPARILRTFILALMVYAVVVIVFGKLLIGGKAYLPYALGAMLDALLTIGIAFNFIFLLLMTTKLFSPSESCVRRALQLLRQKRDGQCAQA